MRDGPMDLDVLECEVFSGVVSDSMLQRTFQKLPLVEFWCSIKEGCPQLSDQKNLIKQSSLFQLPICERLDFLRRLESK